MNKKLRHISRANSTLPQKISSNGARDTQNQPITSNKEQPRFDALVAQGDYDRALQFLHSSGRNSSSQHDMAVCLMRLGRYTEAVDILRKLVLNYDCVWMRKDVPLAYRTNFATALLLGGHPAGCRSLLGELNDETIPAVIRMREIMNQWENTLTFWQRLNWRFLGIEPSNKPVLFDGVAGDFQTAVVVLPTPRSHETPVPSIKMAT